MAHPNEAEPGKLDGAFPAAPVPRHGAAPKRPSWLWLVVFVVVVALVVTLYRSGFDSGGGAETRGELTYEVARNPLQVTVAAEGNVESASNVEVKCRVSGGGTILWLVQDGKMVEVGEELVRLDTSAIEQQLNSQSIVYENSRAAHIQAQEAFEVAKISIQEYEEGTYVEQLNLVEADIRVGLENLRSAENQLEYSKRMVRKGFVSTLQREADEFAVERAGLDLANARTRKKVLVDFTRTKTVKDLEAQREAAGASFRAAEAALRLEKARLDSLEEQKKQCVVTAPAHGMVVHANNTGRRRFGGSDGPQIEEGAVVRESQDLVRLPDLSRMQVRVTIHESRVNQLRVGLPARIMVQEREFSGRVIQVANQPQPTSYFSANVKEYATVVSIEGDRGTLRPGMTAQVTILIENLESALTLPVSAVVEQQADFFCWVKTSDGPQRRTLQLGSTNDKWIEVIDGVKEGDVVLRNPRALVEEARQDLAFEEQLDPGAFREVPAGAAAGASSNSSLGDSAGAVPAAAGGPSRSPGQGRRRGGFDLKTLDKDGDGKVSLQEAPERMRGFFSRIDANGDGFLEEAELRSRRGRRGGDGNRRGSAGGEGRADSGGKGRPE